MSTLVGWWKGEDNTDNTLGGNSVEFWNGTPDYDTGIVNRCFKQTATSREIRTTARYAIGHSTVNTIEFYSKILTFTSIQDEIFEAYGEDSDNEFCLNITDISGIS